MPLYDRRARLALLYRRFFSNSLLEAMACGCCAEASNVEGNPELVCDGETGLLIEPLDAAGFFRASHSLWRRTVELAPPDLRARGCCMNASPSSPRRINGQYLI